MPSRTELLRSVRKAVSSLDGQAARLGITSPVPSVEELRAAALKAGRLLALGEHLGDVPKSDSPTARIDVVDVFSGCGGISAGFRLFGSLLPVYRLAGALDIDDDANKAYEDNLCVRPFCEDAHKVVNKRSAWARFHRNLTLKPGNLVVVAGGPPCQGFTSHKRTIIGCDGLNVLYPDFARIAVRLSADVVIMENVPELLTERSWPYYAEAVSVMKRAGYRVRTRVYNLAGFGLPQERFRAVTLAMKSPFAMPEALLTEKDRFRAVRAAIGHLPPITPGNPHPADPEHVTAGHRASTIATIRAVAKDGGRRPEDVGPACLRRLAERNGRSGYDDVYGRLWWNRPSVTITGSSRNPASGRFVHPDQDRGLSVREAALLQGFPSSYRFFGSFDSRFLQVGNAVAPSVAAHLAGHVLAELLANRKDFPAKESDVEAPLGTSFSRLIAGIKQGTIRV